MVEKHTEPGIYNPVEMHLLLQLEGLVSRLCTEAAGGKVWRQSINGFPKWLQIFFKQSEKFPFAAALEFSELAVCCLIAQTEYIFCCQILFPFHEINTIFFRHFD